MRKVLPALGVWPAAIGVLFLLMGQVTGLVGDGIFTVAVELCLVPQAAKRAEVARLRELHTLKGHVESVVKLKGLDIETINQSYTV
jgi:hypothetical protein